MNILLKKKYLNRKMCIVSRNISINFFQDLNYENNKINIFYCSFIKV